MGNAPSCDRLGSTMKQRIVTEQDPIRFASENAEAYSAGDWRRFKALFAPDLIYHEMASQRRLQGADQLVQSRWERQSPCALFWRSTMRF